MNHLDLFSGIGGFSLAGQWVWDEDHHIHCFVETDLFCQKVLKKHWPNTPIHYDIRAYKHDGTKIDLLTGGFPCQPFSVAGKQRGSKDDRYLWPEMFRVIAEVRPTWIIGENVAGIIHMELDKVLSDLENQGYETQALIIPACAVDAPHRRDRVWIVAHSTEQREGWRGIQGPYKNCTTTKKWTLNKLTGSSKNVADTPPERLQRIGTKGEQKSNIYGKTTEIMCNSSNRAKWLPEPAICELDDGISPRLVRYRGRVASSVPNHVAKLKALGNAIVPQVVVPIMENIKKIEELDK